MSVNYIASSGTMDDQWIRKDLEGSSRGLLEVLTRH
jgi:hypothetical protein